MTYLDPRKEPNKWLKHILLDLLEQNTEGTRDVLKSAIIVLTMSIEPGLVDSAFQPWISVYSSLLDEENSNQNTDHQKHQLDNLPE